MPELLESLSIGGGLLCCCPINIVEVYAGMKDKEKSSTDEFLNSLECHEITGEIGYHAGDLKRRYLKKGITFSTSDALIAATAIRNNLILVTNNPKHFPSDEAVIHTYGR